MKPIIITTEQGSFKVEPAATGVSVKFKPHIWPEVGMILKPLEASALVDALELCRGALAK